ncbi:MAG: gluconate 2-dehydrogenase subunit 3 family protein [Proteobacteria bacterium]|nr:gluconate 2-dehydrogenase subunit 3 family protein [Pseudomonadota bacterium]MCP4918452.1 gluconate 2-dehydrogenase subunit 3 family protein [Pseudomonadota bacterium]
MLAGTAAIAAASLVGAGTVGLAWYDQPAGQGLTLLSDEEAAFVIALSEAIYPPGGSPPVSGAEIGIEHFIDAALAGMPGFQQQGLKLLCHAIDALGGGFTEKPLAERSALVLEWLAHPLAEIRSGVQSLVLLIGMGYTTHPSAVAVFSDLTRCGYGR